QGEQEPPAEARPRGDERNLPALQERRGGRDRLAADRNHPRRLLRPVSVMAEAEILQAVDRLTGPLAALAGRGLGPGAEGQLAPLVALQEEFERIGAGHLAGRIAALLEAVRSEEKGAAAALLRVQTSLRLFERIMTVERAEQLLEEFVAAREGEA